jgi:uncharacterized protein HemX
VDNNSSIPQPAIPTNTQPVQPVAPPSANGSGGNKVVLWFVAGLIIVVALVGGIYFYLSRQQGNSITNQNTSVESPVPTAKEDLEQGLNSINVDISTESSDFIPIDQDIQQL